MTEKAIEMTGRIDENSRLVLDEPLPVAGLSRVKVIILIPEEADIDERSWLRAVEANPAFAFLRDPKEDIFTVADGKPFHDSQHIIAPA